MSGQICPIFERENEEKINLVGAWMQHPINLKIVPDEANFLEIGHIAPMLSAFIRNEACREVPNSEIDIGRGCKFISGAFIIGENHSAPNEKGGLPEKDYEYYMKQNDGVVILVREKKSNYKSNKPPKTNPIKSNSFTEQDHKNEKKWWQFWR